MSPETFKASHDPLLSTRSPFKSGQKSFKKGEEKKAEPCSPDVNSSSSPKPTGKGETERHQKQHLYCTNSTYCVALMTNPCLKHLSFTLNHIISSLLISCLPLHVTYLLPSFLLSVSSSRFSSESDEAVTSPTSDRAAVAKKRFTLQGFSNIKAQKGNCRPLSISYPTHRIIFSVCEVKGCISSQLKSKDFVESLTE